MVEVGLCVVYGAEVVVERGLKIRTGAGGGVLSGVPSGWKVKLLLRSWLGFEVWRRGLRAWFALGGVGAEGGDWVDEGAWVIYLVERNTLEWGEE